MKHINLKLRKDQKNLYLYFLNQELDPFWKICFSHEFNTAGGLLFYGWNHVKLDKTVSMFSSYIKVHYNTKEKIGKICQASNIQFTK